MFPADATPIAAPRHIPAIVPPAGFTIFDDWALVVGADATTHLGPSRPARWPLLVLIAIPWFFYRKMYLAGATSLLAAILLTVHAPIALIAFAVVSALAAQPMYRRFVRSRIAKANARALEGDARSIYLSRAGGTSAAAGGFAIAIILPLLSAVTYGHLLQVGWL